MARSLIDKDGTLAVKWYLDSEGTVRRMTIEGTPQIPDAKALAGILVCGPALAALENAPVARPERLLVTMKVDGLHEPRAPRPRSTLFEPLFVIPAKLQNYSSIRLSHDGKELAVGRPEALELVQTQTGQTRIAIKNSASAQYIDFSLDGGLLAFANANGINIARTDTGALVKSIPQKNHSFYSLRLSPDGKTIAATRGGPEGVEIWNVDQGTVERTLKGSGLANSAIFSQDGTRLVTAEWMGDICVWDTRTWTIVHRLPVRTNAACPVALSPDGNMIAIVDNDNVVHLWSLLTGKEVRDLKGAYGRIQTMAFSSDAKSLLATDCDDGDDMPQLIPGAISWNVITGATTFNHYAWLPEVQNDSIWGIISPNGRLAVFVDATYQREALKLYALPEGP
jgi:WD40 repeat protein